MPSSPSPSFSVQAARQSLAARLRELRHAAELSGTDLAAAVGWHKSKVSRIEKAVQPVTQSDIRAWCEACGVLSGPLYTTNELTKSTRGVEPRPETP